MFDQVILCCRVLSRLVLRCRSPTTLLFLFLERGCLSFSWSLGKTNHKTISLQLLRLPMVDLIDLPVLPFTSILPVHCKLFLNQGKWVPENNLYPIAFYFGVSIILIFGKDNQLLRETCSWQLLGKHKWSLDFYSIMLCLSWQSFKKAFM